MLQTDKNHQRQCPRNNTDTKQFKGYRVRISSEKKKVFPGVCPGIQVHEKLWSHSGTGLLQSVLSSGANMAATVFSAPFVVSSA